MSEKHKVIGFIIVLLHLVGGIGTLISETRELMISLTPWNLLLSTALILTGHRDSLTHLSIFFLVSFIIGFSVEILGVKTGFPFGDYSYGKTLGLKLFDVPLIIGVNWFLLSYSFGVLAGRITGKKYISVFIASVGMVLLDILIEPVAVSLDYWSWEGNIPITNYLGWFVTAGIIQIFFVNFKFLQTNKLIPYLLFGQTLYFGLMIILK